MDWLRTLTVMSVQVRYKVKLLLCLIKEHAIKTYGQVEVELYALLSSAIDGGQWSASSLKEVVHLSKLQLSNASFKDFAAVMFQVEVFWVVMPRGVVVGYQRFRGSFCFHLHPEDLILKLQVPSICST
jgi:hypothetical protein